MIARASAAPRRLALLLIGLSVIAVAIAPWPQPSLANPTASATTAASGVVGVFFPVPPPPTDLDCDFKSSVGTLTWEPSPGATGYSVFHSPKGEEVFEFLHAVDGGDTITTTVGPPAIGYLFRVIAVGPGGKSEPSNAVHCPPEPE